MKNNQDIGESAEERGDFGDNPDPRLERYEKFKADEAWRDRLERTSDSLESFREKLAKDDLESKFVAFLFLSDIGQRKGNLGIDDIPLEDKVYLLKKYEVFTGIINPDYPAGAENREIEDEFTRQYSIARRLFQ